MTRRPEVGVGTGAAASVGPATTADVFEELAAAAALGVGGGCDARDQPPGVGLGAGVARGEAATLDMREWRFSTGVGVGGGAAPESGADRAPTLAASTDGAAWLTRRSCEKGSGSEGGTVGAAVGAFHSELEGIALGVGAMRAGVGQPRRPRLAVAPTPAGAPTRAPDAAVCSTGRLASSVPSRRACTSRSRKARLFVRT